MRAITSGGSTLSWYSRVWCSKMSQDGIETTRDSTCRRVFAPIQGRQGLARQRQHSWLMAQLHDVAVGFDDLVGVAGPKRDQPGNGPQRYQLLHRLVGRAILAVTHRVVREDEDRG